MKFDKKYLVFLFLGAVIAICVEQLGWWQLIISNPGKMHNDFWILISEDINTSQQGSNLNVLYSTDLKQANLVLNIWKILLVISLISTIILLFRKW
jgi:uncharacterized membrane protein